MGGSVGRAGGPPPAVAWKAARKAFAVACYALALIIFWIPALLLSSAVRLVPWLRRRPALARRAVSRLLTLFCSILRALGLVRIKVEGREKLPAGPCVIAANHPTLIDALVLMSVFPSAVCVVKGALTDNPVLRPLIEALGHLVVTDATLIARSVEAVESGASLLVFPEGTRSLTGEVGPFRRGAATVAIRAKVPVVPVVVTSNPRTLGKGQRWRELPDGMVDLAMRVCYPLPPIEPGDGDERTVALLLTGQLEALFRSELVTSR